jgi:hypothetical protein
MDKKVVVNSTSTKIIIKTTTTMATALDYHLRAKTDEVISIGTLHIPMLLIQPKTDEVVLVDSVVHQKVNHSMSATTTMATTTTTTPLDYHLQPKADEVVLVDSVIHHRVYAI